MSCERCLNKDECWDCCPKQKEPDLFFHDNEEEHKMVVVKFCPKCRKQAAEYHFNEAGNLAFHKCVCCGYTAKDYAKDLKEGGSRDKQVNIK